MSTLALIQRELADLINADPRFARMGARAFAFDAADIWAEEQKWLAAADGMVEISVLTSSGRYLGDAALEGGGRGIRMDVSVEMVCIENPALRQGAHGPAAVLCSALDVAEALALRFNNDQIRFRRFAQDAEPKGGTISVTAEFSTSAVLDPADGQQQNQE